MYLYVYALLFTCMTGLGLGENDVKCKAVGFQCDKDKKKIEFCKKINADPEEIETCEGDQVCNQEKHNVRCIDPGNVDIKFICTGKGEFPDTKNCSRTYICEGEGEEPSEVCACPTDTSVYPVPGLFCMPGKCPRENITCTEGAHGYFTLTNKQKTSYYYYCLNSDTVQVYENVEVPAQEVIEKVASRLRIMKNNGKECIPRMLGSSSPTSTESTTPSSSSLTSTESTTPGSSSPTSTESTTPSSSSPTSTESTTPGSSSPTSTESTTPGSSSPTSTESTTPSSSSPTSTESTTPSSSSPTSTYSTVSDSTTLKSTEPTKATPTPVPPEKKPTCKRRGDLHETECDCDYYKCDSNLRPIRRTCSDGLRYHAKLKKCIFGECDESKCIYRALKSIF